MAGQFRIGGAIYRSTFIASALAAALLPAVSGGDVRGQGLFLPSAGPINQSMGGASTAAPIDSAGAMYWNPAAISGIRQSEMAFGFGLLLPSSDLTSSVPANTFGAGVPPIALAGATGSEPGTCAIPTISFVHRNQDSPWTLGLGIFGVGGFSVNYAASTGANPILSPPPPNGIGLGRLYGKGQFYQMAPTVSFAVSEKLSIGVGPTLTMADVSLDPFFLAAPNDANGDTFFTYGSGTGIRTIYGGGFQVGAYYITDYNIHLGASYKSQQWFEDIRANSVDELGAPTVLKADVDLPSITSLGVAFDGIEGLLFATDVRYFAYGDADGFRQSGFDPGTGAVQGLGWRSVFSVSNGVQWTVGPRLTLRGGHSWNQNPIVDSQAMFNVQSSLIIQHWLSFGGTFRWSDRVSSSIAYTHGFENSISGPIVLPAGTFPTTTVSEYVSVDILTIGMTVNF
jgi:long-chain fatty acid transport protein